MDSGCMRGDCAMSSLNIIYEYKAEYACVQVLKMTLTSNINMLLL